MSFVYIYKVLIVLVIANILPVIICIPIFRYFPRLTVIISIPTVVIGSSYIRQLLNFGPDVNKVANIIGGVFLFLMIFLCEKYKIFEKFMDSKANHSDTN